MLRRRIVIGVIGGDRQPDDFAFALGAAVARAGCILLTGGQPSARRDVKNAAMAGAVAAEGAGALARLIAVIPTPGPADWDGAAPVSLSEAARAGCGRRLILDSGQPHHVRNLVNGVTPDVLVALGGDAGTLAEIAFAAAAGKPILFHHAVARLAASFEACFMAPDVREANRRLYFTEPLSRYRAIAGRPWTADGLVALLGEVLARAHDAAEQDADALVARCVDLVDAGALHGDTGFPGLPDDGGSKQDFERIVRAMTI